MNKIVLDKKGICEYQQKREPYLLIDYATEIIPGKSAKGYKNFSHVELKVVETDILELHHDGHIRFKVNDDEKIFFLSP